MIYFLLWMVITIVHLMDFKYFIFLTNWGFIMWNSYLVVSAATVTAAFYHEACLTRKEVKNVKSNQVAEKPCISRCNSVEQLQPQLRYGCCRTRVASPLSSSPGMRIAHKVQWFLFLIGGEFAVVISILYWVFYSGSGSEHNLYSLDSLNLHTINGIVAVLDLWFSGVPVRFYHAVYSIAFGCAYVAFTGLYYVAGGTGLEGSRYIYPFLDYSLNPKAAIALATSSAVLLVGLVHCIFFVQYIIRGFITSQLHHSPTSMGPSKSFDP